MSTLRSIPRVLVCFREWIISWVRIIPSRICPPSMKPIYSGKIRPRRRGFNLFAKTFMVILSMTLQREIGWNLHGEFVPYSFRIRVRKVELKSLRTLPIHLDSSTISQTSSLTRSQHCWKKSTVKSSSPGAFPFSSWKTASSTSSLSMGLINIALCSAVANLGMFCVMVVVSLTLSSYVSLSRSK